MRRNSLQKILLKISKSVQEQQIYREKDAFYS